MKEQDKPKVTTDIFEAPTVKTHANKASIPRKPLSRRAFASLVIALCLVAGFGGAAVFSYSGLIDTTQVVNSSKVVLQEGELVADVAEKVGPSVVSIVTESTSRTVWGYSAQSQSAGTGIIISKDGYIVTNKHVISGATSGTITVTLADGTTYEKVTIAGSDPSNDIAFLKITDVSNLTPATLGDSSSLSVGQKVIAIGNALGEYQNTVTSGIVSALGRPVTASDSTGQSTETLENLIQTDAAINSGNSGGPLVNLNGEIVAITTAVASDAQGIGFAIPINDVKGMVKTLLASGKVVKPYIGVRYVSITPNVVKQYNLSVTKGALVLGSDGEAAVVAGSPAEKAGFKDKDIITKVGDVAVDSQHPFASVIAQYTPGDKVTITYVRDGKTVTLTVEIGSRS